jgi:hypothetical protein
MKRVSKSSRLSRPTQKRTSAIPATIAKLIKKAWPDGIVEMPIEDDESYFWDIYDKLKTKISRMRGAWMFHERPASPDASSIDDEGENGLDEAWQEGSRSYHLFVIQPQTTIRLPIDEEEDTEEDEDYQADEAQDDVETESEFGAEGFDEPEVIGASLSFLLAISLVAPVAIVMDYVIAETEYGTDTLPPLGLPCAFDSAGKAVEPDHRSHLSAEDRKRADAIRQRLVCAVEETGLTVLPFDQRQMTVPGLQAGSETFLSEPITLQDAFFFEGP